VSAAIFSIQNSDLPHPLLSSIEWALPPLTNFVLGMCELWSITKSIGSWEWVTVNITLWGSTLVQRYFLTTHTEWEWERNWFHHSHHPHHSKSSHPWHTTHSWSSGWGSCPWCSGWGSRCWRRWTTGICLEDLDTWNW
jgi:hypothetical protein